VLDGVKLLATGDNESCVVRTDDSLWCWGYQHGAYAAPYLGGGYPATNVAAVGDATSPRFLTADGRYHLGATARDASCDASP
jgi:hypothetical protein